MVTSIIGLSGRPGSRLPVNRSGSILIIALWSLCLLATFSVILGYQARAKIALLKRLDYRGELRLIAEAGIKSAIVELKKSPHKAYDSLKDNWSNNPFVFKDRPVGEGKFSIIAGFAGPGSEGLRDRWGMVDEESKININTADIEVMKRLFSRVLGLDETGAQELAACIIDWRNAGSELSIPLGSAGNSYYRSLAMPYEAKNAEFEVLDELLLVKGVDKEVFEKLKMYVTIYGSGKVNINTAPEPVLFALGLDSDIVGKIISYRFGKDGLPGTDGDSVFIAPGDIVPVLSQAFHLNDSEIAQISRVAEKYLITSSSNFSARCVAQLNNARLTREVDCVINRGGDILYWREL